MLNEKPEIPLQPGQNYRFHFDASKCVGCKCCEVACHEQNNNPATVKWRTVGEVEGGEFPETKRFYMSMSCNHCLDPACLKGCPVDAYEKDEVTGVVKMKEETCIGCQYCTWNCPYGAPQFNPERGMVTKCDMCHNRLAEGNKPACVEACPSGALEIETFDVAPWKKDFQQANAPGVPDASITLSTTRITQPKTDGLDLKRIDDYRVKPEHPHYSLIFLTVLTQLAVGGFVCLFFLELLYHIAPMTTFIETFLRWGQLSMLGTALLALNTSVFHLGRPLHALRALKMWRRSWLSREVLFFTLFAGGATGYSVLTWQNLVLVPDWMKLILGIGVSLVGLIGIYCSAMIYRVPARPTWDTPRTPIAFFSTAFILGPLLALTIFAWSAQNFIWEETLPTLQVIGTFLVGLLFTGGVFQLGGILVKLFNSFYKEEPELRASARMLTHRFRNLFLTRMGILLLGFVTVPMVLFGFALGKSQQFPLLPILLTILMITILLSEFMGRYLFFVTVVPKKRPEGYF